jgi:hypothetical protein
LPICPASVLRSSGIGVRRPVALGRSTEDASPHGTGAGKNPRERIVEAAIT